MPETIFFFILVFTTHLLIICGTIFTLFPKVGMRCGRRICHRLNLVSEDVLDAPISRRSIIFERVLGSVFLILGTLLMVKHLKFHIAALLIVLGVIFILFPDIGIRYGRRICYRLRLVSKDRLDSPIKRRSVILKRVEGLALLILVRYFGVLMTLFSVDGYFSISTNQTDGPAFKKAVRTVIASEGPMLDAPEAGAAKELRIISAKYGAHDTWIDVEEQVKEQIDSNTLEIKVSNAIAGDPLPGSAKTLNLEYTLDGKHITAAFREGLTVRIPGDPYDALKTITTTERLVALAKACPAEVGFYGKNLTTGKTVEYRLDQPACLASIVKIFPLLEVMRQVEQGSIDLSAPITIERQEGKETCTITEALDKMIGISDNDATTALAKLVGHDEINALPRELGITGLSDQILPRPGVLGEVLDKRVHGLRIPQESNLLPQHGTARGIVRYFELLHKNELVNERISQRVLAVFDRNPKYFAPRATPANFRSGGKGGSIGWTRPGRTPYNMAGWGILIRSDDVAIAFCLWCEWFPAGTSRETQRQWYFGLSDCIVNILLFPLSGDT